VLGKSANCDKISAARVLQKKAVFYVANVNVSCSADELKAFVEDMNVIVVSCFQVQPRKRRNGDQSRDMQRAFRLCINENDRKRMLNAANWPASVIVSDWYFKRPNSVVQGRTDGNIQR